MSKKFLFTWLVRIFLVVGLFLSLASIYAIVYIDQNLVSQVFKFFLGLAGIFASCTFAKLRSIYSEDNYGNEQESIDYLFALGFGVIAVGLLLVAFVVKLFLG